MEDILDTGIFIKGAVDANELYQHALDAVMRFDPHGRTAADIHELRFPTPNFPGATMIGAHGTHTGIAVIYREDGGPVRTDEDFLLSHATCPSDACSPDDHVPGFQVAVTFRNSRDFADVARNWNAGDLHAALVSAVGLMLDGLGIEWDWANDVSGINHGYEGLDQLPKKLDEETQRQKTLRRFSGVPIPLNSTLGFLLFADAMAAKAAAAEEEDDEDPEDEQYGSW